VTVADPPTGFTITAISGPGWGGCTPGTPTCQVQPFPDMDASVSPAGTASVTVTLALVAPAAASF